MAAMAVAAAQAVTAAPVLKNAPDTDPRKLYWDYANNHAVRDGRWKLVQSNLSGNWELYDIDADRGETRDLAAEHFRRPSLLLDGPLDATDPDAPPADDPNAPPPAFPPVAVAPVPPAPNAGPSSASSPEHPSIDTMSKPEG